jgi:hypothetical protein
MQPLRRSTVRCSAPADVGFIEYPPSRTWGRDARFTIIEGDNQRYGRVVQQRYLEPALGEMIGGEAPATDPRPAGYDVLPQDQRTDGQGSIFTSDSNPYANGIRWWQHASAGLGYLRAIRGNTVAVYTDRQQRGRQDERTIRSPATVTASPGGHRHN